MRITSRGFSLVELLVATALTMGLGAAVFHLFHQDERILRDEALLMEMRQTARLVAAQINDDIRIAGQSLPPSTTGFENVAIAGSSTTRLHLRAGYSATETQILASLPLLLAVGSTVTLPVESTAGFSKDREAFLWDSESWLRATIVSVSGSAKTVKLTLTEGSGSAVSFPRAPSLSLDEAVAVFWDSSARAVRRTTSTDTSDAEAPDWAPANELATNVESLTFHYYDATGGELTPSTPDQRSRIAWIEDRIVVNPSSKLKGIRRQTYSLTMRAAPRNLQFR